MVHRRGISVVLHISVTAVTAASAVSFSSGTGGADDRRSTGSDWRRVDDLQFVISRAVFV